MRHSATILREVWCSGLVVTTSSRSASTSRINSKIVTSRRRRRSNSARRWRGISRPSPVRKTARSRSHERREGPFPNALGEQQCFNSVLDAKLLLHQVLALAVYAPRILLFRRRHAYHAADPPPPSCSTGKSRLHFWPPSVDFCGSRWAIGAATERARAPASAR